MTVGLLEAEFDEEPEKLSRVERAGDMSGIRVVRPQRQAEQYAENAHQSSTGSHFPGWIQPPLIPSFAIAPRLA